MIRNILPVPLRSDMLEQLEDHKRRCAEALGRDYDQYKNEISQHRDLHLLGGALKEAIYGEKGCPLNQTIMAITGWSGCKLFHDHVINKPRFGSNSFIPAHQDSMFWPVDRPGVSCLAALEPVETTGGCLEVIDQSHRYGCDEPVDFMAPEVGFSELHPSLTQYKLPLEAGSAVLLNSLTYHRSSPNEAVMTSQEPCTRRTGDRPVHLSMWVPPCTKWRPDLVDWHPVNDHLTNLQPGALMQHETRHPWFGTYVELPDAAPLHCGTRYSHEGITMYNASKKTAAQLREVLGDADPVASVSAMLSDEESATRIFQRLCDTAVCNPSQKQELLGVLERLRICTEAYEKIRARNVFNEAYAVWWKLVGEKWETRVDFDTPLSNEEVRSYLERIGVVFRTTADLNLLTEIVQKTLAVIPFQNFSMLTDPLVRPTKVQIVSAMVTGIGGLCNVRNPFLFLLLKTLGFDVSFISCTICDAPHGKELPDAHIALLVNIASNTYWVDVGNGYPYVKPLEINGLESDAPDSISHDFVNVRIVVESSSGTEGRIYAVQHRRSGTSEWRTNNFLRASPVSYVHFDKLHYGHYNPSKDFEGPFLSGLRFNMWSADHGSYIKLVDRYVMLRSREPTRNADKEMESRAEFEAVMGNFLRSQVDADVIDKFLSLAHKAWNVTLCRKAGWPVGKFSSALWDPRVESLVDSKPIAVILTTGAMNPGHKGHVHVVKQAQKRLIAAGYKVVGSWISPSNEEYLKEKFAHEEGVILPASLRLELLEEMTRTEPTIEVGKWEVENLQSVSTSSFLKFVRNLVNFCVRIPSFHMEARI